jgi:hypothetical protein
VSCVSLVNSLQSSAFSGQPKTNWFEAVRGKQVAFVVSDQPSDMRQDQNAVGLKLKADR